MEGNVPAWQREIKWDNSFMALVREPTSILRFPWYTLITRNNWCKLLISDVELYIDMLNIYLEGRTFSVLPVRFWLCTRSQILDTRRHRSVDAALMSFAKTATEGIGSHWNCVELTGQSLRNLDNKMAGSGLYSRSYNRISEITSDRFLMWIIYC